MGLAEELEQECIDRNRIGPHKFTRSQLVDALWQYHDEYMKNPDSFQDIESCNTNEYAIGVADYLIKMMSNA